MVSENKAQNHTDTIKEAKEKASLCFSSGKNASANPYRNICGSVHNAELYAAFEDTLNSLHFNATLKKQK